MSQSDPENIPLDITAPNGINQNMPPSSSSPHFGMLNNEKNMNDGIVSTIPMGALSPALAAAIGMTDPNGNKKRNAAAATSSPGGDRSGSGKRADDNSIGSKECKDAAHLFMTLPSEGKELPEKSLSSSIKPLYDASSDLFLKGLGLPQASNSPPVPKVEMNKKSNATKKQLQVEALSELKAHLQRNQKHYFPHSGTTTGPTMQANNCGQLLRLNLSSQVCKKMGIKSLQPVVVGKNSEVSMRFQVLEKIGKGGFGDVYKIQHTSQHQRHNLPSESKQFALKVIPFRKPQQRDDALKEAAILGMFDTSFVVKIFHHEVCDHCNVVLILMELGGCSVRDYITRYKIPIKTVMQLSSDIASSLHILHKGGIAHCDVKPANYLICCDDPGNHRSNMAMASDVGCAHFVYRSHLIDATARDPDACYGMKGKLILEGRKRLDLKKGDSVKFCDSKTDITYTAEVVETEKDLQVKIFDQFFYSVHDGPESQKGGASWKELMLGRKRVESGEDIDVVFVREFRDDSGEEYVHVPITVGTVIFMAPEMIKKGGNRLLNQKIDVWSLGITLFFLLCKTYPKELKADKIADMAEKIMNFDLTFPKFEEILKLYDHDPTSTSEKNLDRVRNLVLVIRGCLERNVNTRLNAEQADFLLTLGNYTETLAYLTRKKQLNMKKTIRDMELLPHGESDTDSQSSTSDMSTMVRKSAAQTTPEASITNGPISTDSNAPKFELEDWVIHKRDSTDSDTSECEGWTQKGNVIFKELHRKKPGFVSFKLNKKDAESKADKVFDQRLETVMKPGRLICSENSSVQEADILKHKNALEDLIGISDSERATLEKLDQVKIAANDTTRTFPSGTFPSRKLYLKLKEYWSADPIAREELLNYETEIQMPMDLVDNEYADASPPQIPSDGVGISNSISGILPVRIEFKIMLLLVVSLVVLSAIVLFLRALSLDLDLTSAFTTALSPATISFRMLTGESEDVITTTRDNTDDNSPTTINNHQDFVSVNDDGWVADPETLVSFPDGHPSPRVYFIEGPYLGLGHMRDWDDARHRIYSQAFDLKQMLDNPGMWANDHNENDFIDYRAMRNHDWGEFFSQMYYEELPGAIAEYTYHTGMLGGPGGLESGDIYEDWKDETQRAEIVGVTEKSIRKLGDLELIFLNYNFKYWPQQFRLWGGHSHEHWRAGWKAGWGDGWKLGWEEKRFKRWTQGSRGGGPDSMSPDSPSAAMALMFKDSFGLPRGPGGPFEHFDIYRKSPFWVAGWRNGFRGGWNQGWTASVPASPGLPPSLPSMPASPGLPPLPSMPASPGLPPPFSAPPSFPPPIEPASFAQNVIDIPEERATLVQDKPPPADPPAPPEAPHEPTRAFFEERANEWRAVEGEWLDEWRDGWVLGWMGGWLYWEMAIFGWENFQVHLGPGNNYERGQVRDFLKHPLTFFNGGIGRVDSEWFRVAKLRGERGAAGKNLIGWREGWIVGLKYANNYWEPVVKGQSDPITNIEVPQFSSGGNTDNKISAADIKGIVPPGVEGEIRSLVSLNHNIIEDSYENLLSKEDRRIHGLSVRNFLGDVLDGKKGRVLAYDVQSGVYFISNGDKTYTHVADFEFYIDNKEVGVEAKEIHANKGCLWEENLVGMTKLSPRYPYLLLNSLCKLGS